MNRSPRKSATQWAELVSEYASGQESERDFCARHGVKLATLRKWRTHFKARDKQAANPAQTSAFVKVNVQQRPVSNDAAVLHIGNDLRLECPTGLDIDSLAKLTLAVHHGR